MPGAHRWQLGLGRENGLIFWGMIFLEASFGSYFALWPIWIEELGASVATVGLMLGLGGVLRLFALLPSAWLGRRFGMKRTIIFSRTCAVISTGWAAFAQDWRWLIISLVGMAIGDLAFPLVNNLVSANAGEQRVRAFAIILTTGPSISLMFTPLLSGALVAAWGLRAPFIAAAIFSTVSILCFTRLSSGSGAVGDGGGNDGDHGSYRDLLHLPGVPLLLVLQFLTFFSLGMGTSLLSIYLHEEGGYAESVIPPMTAATAVGSILFSWVVARSRLVTMPLRAVAIATAAAALGYLLFYLKADLLPVALAGLVLRGGFFAAWPLFAAVLGEATPERMRPHVFAMGEILAGTGFVAAPVFAGRLYGVSPELPLLVSVAMIVPLAIVLAATRLPHLDEEPA